MLLGRVLKLLVRFLLVQSGSDEFVLIDLGLGVVLSSMEALNGRIGVSFLRDCWIEYCGCLSMMVYFDL